MLNAIGRLLSSDGLDVEKFSEAACFLARARAHPVRLAIIDVCMPGMSGFEVLAKLRAATPEAQVIMMTGEDNPNHRISAMTGGAVAFFQKPFDATAFLSAVREVMAPSA